jgi:hypothetical protein
MTTIRQGTIPFQVNRSIMVEAGLCSTLNPYDFVILGPSLYFIFSDYWYKFNIFVLTVISLVPLLFWFYPSIRHNFPEMFQAGILILSIFDYVDIVCFILIL